MTGGTCPDCGMDTVCSYHEFREVYAYRSILKRHAPAFRQLKNSPKLLSMAKTEYGNNFSDYELCLVWVNQDLPTGENSSITDIAGPAYVCVGCYQPLSSSEFRG